jgi:transcriptional regulator with GAF, ATPase, and Fis domain
VLGLLLRGSPMTLHEMHGRLDRDEISVALRTTGGNVAAAARMLDISVRSMWLKIRRHKIKVSEFYPPEHPSRS